jgi:hypothetical protein
LAVSSGLASPAQARSVINWLDNGQSFGPDGKGRNDIYHFAFAPRATTIHNDEWWSATLNPKDYPWSDQIQNGGAVLFESYYDMMSRLCGRGVDDAYNRLLGILRRYAESDRLTGGSPLCTGDSVQGGGPPAGVGVMSYEFPETSLVPAFFVHGLLGAEAKADGLHLTPAIPAAQPFIRAEHVFYHGAYFDIQASADSLTIRVTPVKQTYDFEIAGQRFVAPFEWRSKPGQGNKVIVKPIARAIERQ